MQHRLRVNVFRAGDNFYWTGVDSVKDPRWRSTFEDIYTGTELDIPFFMLLGNHDVDKRCARTPLYPPRPVLDPPVHVCSANQSPQNRRHKLIIHNHPRRLVNGR